ncbi:MAG: DUF4860 domain-containing protein [Lachnospiraceae bacterium]|nr:DUF4860 domain-containing protein [Lachnospiraceae bacterium]
MNEKQNRHIIDILFVISLFAMFVLSAVFLISIGARIYSNTMDNMNSNFDSRTAVAYINEKVHQSDVSGNVRIGDFDGCEAIIITNYVKDLEYITYIYEYEGYIRELTVRKDIALSPAAGSTILGVKEFSLDGISDTLFKCEVNIDGEDDYSFYVSTGSGGAHEQ